MQNKSKRERLINEIKELRIKRRNEKDKNAKDDIFHLITEKEDELLRLEYGDDNIKRFNMP